MINMDHFGPVMKAVVSVLVVVAFFATVAALFLLSYYKLTLEEGVKEVLLVLVGVEAGAFKDVVGYWIGGSHGSDRKTEIAAAKE